MPRNIAHPSPPGRWRGPWRGVAAVGAVLLALSVAGASVSHVAGGSASEAPHKPASPTPVAGAAPSKAPGSVVLVQMNICNSGMALSCFTFGQAVDEAAEKIRRYLPDLVMVQEVCRNDVYAGDGWGKLAQAMADLHGSARVSVSFVPARNRYTGDPYRCVNGEQFGVALLHHGGDPGGHSGWYRSQDISDETRVWTCATVIEGRLTGCTTHLSTDRVVAMRQCKELMSILRSPWVMPEVVVAGDFNLAQASGQPNDVRRCAPARYDITGDGGLQHVFFSSGIRWVQGGNEAMRLTDHPLLYGRFQL